MKQSIALACFPEISIYSISKALILLLWQERKKGAEKIFDIICEPVDGGAAKGVTGRLIVFRGFDPIASRSKAPYSTKIYYVVSHFLDSEGILMARFF